MSRYYSKIKRKIPPNCFLVQIDKHKNYRFHVNLSLFTRLILHTHNLPERNGNGYFFPRFHGQYITYFCFHFLKNVFLYLLCGHWPKVFSPFFVSLSFFTLLGMTVFFSVFVGTEHFVPPKTSIQRPLWFVVCKRCNSIISKYSWKTCKNGVA